MTSKSTWLVVADSGAARVFSLDTPRSVPREFETLVHPQARLHEHELASDRPGRSFDSTGTGRHDLRTEGSAKRHEAEVFARETARWLAAHRKQDAFDALVLIAPPRFLGLLREVMDEPTRRCVAREIHKDLVHASPARLAEALSAEP